MDVDTIVFDVIGTVIGEASIADDLASVLGHDTAQATACRWTEGIAGAWTTSVTAAHRGIPART
jgi:hypothetical protein